jgi:hypothetical protein
MTYAVSAALQEWVYATLTADATLAGLVGGQVFDAAPVGDAPTLCVVLGDETVRDRSDQSGQGAWHDFRIGVITDDAGFTRAKQAAAAVCDALIGQDAVLSRGRIVCVHFRFARTRRMETGRIRQIELTFRARVTDD